MKSGTLYDKIDNDFIFEGLSDDWSRETKGIEQYLTPSYKKSSMGLMFDFTQNIEKIFTSVFLDNSVINRVKNEKNSMLFVHHPILEYYNNDQNCIMEIISKDSIEVLKNNNISVYNLHIPLDHYGTYSTNNTLADALGLTIIDKFALYRGAYTGLICKTPFSTLNELKVTMENVFVHNVKLYEYGCNDINDKKVAIVAGFGHVE